MALRPTNEGQTKMTATDTRALSAAGLRDALETAGRWLERNRESLNAINVYPVPDGDTGTNMLLTWRAGLAAAARADAADGVGSYLRSFARGALLGARGNSGVILSQMVRGLAAALEADETLDPSGLRRALDAASRTAYEAVSTPVEGTMLTVLKDAAAAAPAASGSILDVFAAAEAEAHASVARTPDLLPRLREAGVVDAGGLGVAVLLTGLRMAAANEPMPDAPAPMVVAVRLEHVDHEGHGYCTEFLVERRDGATLDRDLLVRRLEEAGGESILVVGDPDALHVHVHAQDPGPALSAGIAAGSLDDIKIDNMQAQHERWSAAHRGADGSGPGSAPAYAQAAVVASAAGPGIAAAFRELGAVPMQSDGKPTAGAFLDAARAAASERVFLLPNDRDAVMAAEVAAAEEPDRIVVIPARSIPAGVAAAVAFVADGDPGEVERAMRLAAGAVRCIEVTHAARNVDLEGVAARLGDPIALLDGRLVARGETLEGALLSALAVADGEGAELVTLYLGAGVTPEAGERVRVLVEEQYPGLAVEVVDGGQPYYPYVLGVE